jgi:hypothetical protein
MSTRRLAALEATRETSLSEGCETEAAAGSGARVACLSNLAATSAIEKHTPVDRRDEPLAVHLGVLLANFPNELFTLVGT